MQISIVSTTRNDDHGGQQVPRMNMFMHSVKESAAIAGAEVEIVIVEWNPPADRPPLSEVMEFCLPTKIVTVPQVVHEALPNQNVGPLFQMIAKNVGIRRAAHEYVLSTNPDLFFGSEVFTNLEPLLGKNKIFRVPRVDIKSTELPTSPAYATRIEQLLNHAIVRNNQPWNLDGHPLLTEACGDFQLMHREGWEKIGGYCEWPIWSIHLDSLAAVTAYHAGQQEIVLDSAVYHLDHHRSWVVNPEEQETRPHIEVKDILDFHRIMKVGGFVIPFTGPNWGYNDVDFDTWCWP